MNKGQIGKVLILISALAISGEINAAAASKSTASVSSTKSSPPVPPPNEVVDDQGQTVKNENNSSLKPNEKLFTDIVISGRVLRVRDEVAVDRADKVVNKGLGVRLENPQFDFTGNPSLKKKFEFYHKSVGLWISTNLKNEVIFDDCSNIAQQGRKSESKFKMTFKNYPIHSLLWKDQVHLLNYLKQFFAPQIKAGKMKGKDVEDLSKKGHLVGYIPANVEQIAVSCELIP